MGNSFFRFKAFTIHQQHAGMKVSTDACVFGAWLASLNLRPAQVLDIGTGTGLLTAMLAQHWTAEFTAVEIDPASAAEARANLSNTPWTDRIHVVEADARKLAPVKRYDMIVSNPPFYENQLASSDHRINLARHSSEMTLAELFQVVDLTREKNGFFAVLLPFHRAAPAIAIAQGYGLMPLHKLDLNQTPRHDFFRTCMVFGEAGGLEKNHASLTIVDEQGQYTADALRLLKPYYLKL